MFRHTRVYLGVGTAWLLALGLLWMPDIALASSGSGCAPMHQIASGESLTTIAKRYEVSVDVLVAENSIADPNLISIGQWLCIPADKGKSYEYEYWGDYGVPGQSYDPRTIAKTTSKEVGANVEVYPITPPESTHKPLDDEPIYMIPGRSYAPEVYERARRYSNEYADYYAGVYADD